MRRRWMAGLLSLGMVSGSLPVLGQARVGLVLFGSGIHQKLELPAGDHHLPAIIIPEDTNWYELTLMMDSTDKYYRLGVEYVEITPIQ